MSRSQKKAVSQERPRNKKKSTLYWRTVRRVQKNLFRQGKEIISAKSIVNDYDYDA